MDEQFLPIDINYNKLLEWLLSRRHIKAEWFKQEHIVHEKIKRAKVATADAFKVSESPDYWEVCDYVIKAKEKQLSNAGKLWQEVQKAYEKDSFLLGETAQRMARNVNYELPALKRTLEKARRSEQECTQKAVEAEANATTFSNRFRAACIQHNISGDQIREELALRARQDAPAHFEAVVQGVRGFSDLLAFRDAFIRFSQRRNDSDGVYEASAPLLRLLAQKGNCTVFELETGNPPPSDLLRNAQESGLAQSSDKTTADSDEGEICWDIDEPSVNADEPMNIEIEVVESNTGGETNEPKVVASEIGNQSVSKAQLNTVLEDSERRNELLNELYELEAFLHVRSQETSSSRIASDVIVTLELQTLGDALHSDADWRRSYADAEACFSKWLISVRSCIETLTSVQFVRTMRVRESAAYLDRLAVQLEELRKHAAKNTRLAQSLRVRAAEAQEELNRTQPLIRSLADKTMALKKSVEAQISKRYKNRPVNILGEIYAACSY